MTEDLTRPLGRLELWGATKASGHRRVFVLVSTVVIMVVASIANLTVMRAANFMNQPDDVVQGIIVASAVSLLVAPPVVWSNLGLVIRLFDESRSLRQASITDPLTGVLNRRGFQDAVGRIDPDSGRWLLAMVDLDDFKVLNDTYGHDLGDQVLVTVGRWLTEQAGAAGFVGRLGGDEFAVAMLADPGRAAGTDRHHLRVCDVDFSISIGRAEYLPGGSVEQTFLHADAALYESKAGRSVVRARTRSQPRTPGRRPAADATVPGRPARPATPAARSSAPVGLGPFQRRVICLATKAFWPFVLLVSAGIVGAAVLLAVVLLDLLGLAQAPGAMRTSAIIAAIVTALVAPPVVAYPISLTMRIERVSAALRHAAITDPLTELVNRRGFFEGIAALDAGTEHVVVMVDLNDFKPLNDTHGHDLGDRVLRRTADWLREQVGPGGLAGRMGGDEFACVVPPAGALAGCDPVQHLSVDGIDFSISLGRAALRGRDEVDAALAAADAELYEAKEARRRRAPSTRPEAAPAPSGAAGLIGP